MSIQMSMALDAQSLATISNTLTLNERFVNEMGIATTAMAKMIQEEIPRQMHWKNPRPVLAGSFGIKRYGPFGREVGSDQPHSRRREFGFSGKSDSLGRHFENDPGAFYMRAAIKAVDPKFEPKLEEGAAAAFEGSA